MKPVLYNIELLCVPTQQWR